MTEDPKEDTQEEEPEYKPGTPFNPDDYLRKLPGKQGKYMEVKWRLVWFRSKFPQGTIETEERFHDPEKPFTKIIRKDGQPDKEVTVYGWAKFKATVTDGKGGKATGHKTENAAGFDDYYEKVETGAIGRALAALGFGTQFAPEFAEGERIVDSPVSTQPARSSVAAVTAPRQPTTTPVKPVTPQAPAQPKATVTQMTAREAEAPQPPKSVSPTTTNGTTPPGHFKTYEQLAPYLGPYEQKFFLDEHNLELDTLTSEEQAAIPGLIADWFLFGEDGEPSVRAHWTDKTITAEQYKEINAYWFKTAKVKSEEIRKLVEAVAGKKIADTSKDLNAFQADQVIWLLRHGKRVDATNHCEVPPFVNPQLKAAA